MDKEENNRIISINKKALFDYHILEKFEAGVQLKGTEVKSLRLNGASLKESFAEIKDGEIFLTNLHIAPYRFGNRSNHDPLREKKLLLHRYQINRIFGKVSERGLTLIPLKVYLKNGIIKIELALAKGKKHFNKREKLKKKDMEREIEKRLKGKIKI